MIQWIVSLSRVLATNRKTFGRPRRNCIIVHTYAPFSFFDRGEQFQDFTCCCECDTVDFEVLISNAICHKDDPHHLYNN